MSDNDQKADPTAVTKAPEETPTPTETTDVPGETPTESTGAPSGIVIEPRAKEIPFDTFAACDMRVVRIKDCVAVKKSKKLLQFTLDDGTGEDRTILSGIHAWYEPEDLIGKNVIAIVNIPPRRMMGIDSCGMLLSAVHEEDGAEQLHLMLVDDAIPAGARLC